MDFGMAKSEQKEIQPLSGLEEQMYKSCLKQIVKYLNTTLPPLSESDESTIQSTTPSTKQTKTAKDSKTDARRESRGSYLLRDVVPSKIRKSIDKRISKKTSNGKNRSHKTKSKKQAIA
ncbi:uncharacterized protein VICG_01083 [Vittaforma corneae ATCC 50505]|uniref:Uncharacterized protein n=1 Tax=Vittaforma corneae (strain ATCC 50505) TaxID=993615 RepID=L2GMN4_VITCO|nr:uncharacterized protein VICG_01083 [Vittaforma corneae ATCC 50505]ELA41899.1 hypothetical protein VICG_01083 [Vittaforma corneae ATCC 50505]